MTPRMIKSVAVALTVTLALLPILSAGTAESVLGRWSDGKNALTFRRDGTVVVRPMGQPGHAGSGVTRKFRTEGDRVIIINEKGGQLIHQLRGEVLSGPHGESFKRWDHITVIFGFTMAADGSRRDIKVVGCEDPMDRHEVKGALAEKEKRAGIEIMARRKGPISKEEVGKTRYDFLLFDNHTRTYLPP